MQFLTDFLHIPHRLLDVVRQLRFPFLQPSLSNWFKLAKAKSHDTSDCTHYVQLKGVCLNGHDGYSVT